MTSRSGVPRCVFLLLLVPALAALLPIAAGYLQADPPALAFLGFRFWRWDMAQYLGFARVAGDTGALGLPNPFLTGPQEGRFVLPYLWLVGQISRPFGGSLVFAWHLLGFVTIFAYGALVWFAIRRVLPDAPRVQRDALLLVLFAGGLDWAWRLVTGVEVRELIVQPGWGALLPVHDPPWLAAYGLVLLSLGLAFPLGAVPPRARAVRAAVAAGMGLLAYTVHPYTGAAGLAALGVGAVVVLVTGSGPHRVRAVAAPVAAALAAGLGVVALTLWGLGDPAYEATFRAVAAWRSQEGWGHQFGLQWFPLMYGVPLLLAPFGIRRLWVKAGGLPTGAVPLWTVLLLVLCVAPGLPGRKFQFMLHLPLGILGAAGLAALRDRLPAAGTVRGRLVAGVWALALAGAIIHPVRWVTGIADTTKLYVAGSHLDLLAAVDSRPEGAVLTSLSGGNLVPWKTGKRVYAGHWLISPDPEARQARIARFFDAANPLDQKQAFLREQGIRYVIEDPWTSRLGRVDPRLGLVPFYSNEFGVAWEVPADQ